MAFTKDQQAELKIATEKAQAVADDIAKSSEVQEIVNGIPKKVKVAVYVIGDTLVGFGLVTPPMAIVLGWNDISKIVALSSVFATFGGFLLVMFGIYKSGKSGK